MFTLLGCIIEIGETKTYKSGFQTRSVVVDTGTSAKPNPIKIDCRDYDIQILNDCKINDMLEVLFNVEGRKYEGKFYTNIISQSIKQLGKTEEPVIASEISDDDILVLSNNDMDDLPF